MIRKIVGATVGTPLSPAKIEEKLSTVKTVNGISPDEYGNVNVDGGGGSMSEEELQSAIDNALAQAKASGEFDGKAGVSATHSWNGTTLTIASASGTSSANLKGDAGKNGADGRSIHYLRFMSTYENDTIVGTIVPQTGGLPLKVGDLGISKNGYLYEYTGDTTAGEHNLKYLARVVKDGKDYTLTEADKQEIAELTAKLVDVPTDAHINSLINTALGVIENGTY